MKKSVNFYDFTEAFKANRMRNDNFSYEGLKALFDYVEEYEDSTGEEVELDVIGLCCEYSEYTLKEAIEEHALGVDDVGLTHELDALKEDHVNKRMMALKDDLTKEEEEGFYQQYDDEARDFALVDLLDDDPDAVKVALLEHFEYMTTVIDIPNTNRFILQAH